MVIADVVVAVVFAGIVVTNDGGYFPLVFEHMIGLGLLSVPLILGATARIDADACHLHLVDLVTSTVISRDAFRGVSGTNGVEVMWSDDAANDEQQAPQRVHESAAFGSSLVQVVFPSRRYRVAAEAIEAWAAADPCVADGRGDVGCPTLPVRRRLRSGVILTTLAALGSAQVLGIVLFLIRPDIQPLARRMVVLLLPE